MAATSERTREHSTRGVRVQLLRQKRRSINWWRRQYDSGTL